MRDFFKGWRRKAGLILLVVACVMATAWVASLHSPWWHRINYPDRVYWLEFHDGAFDALQYRPEQLERPVSMMINEEAERRITINFSAWSQMLTLLSAYLLLWKPRAKPKEQPHA